MSYFGAAQPTMEAVIVEAGFIGMKMYAHKTHKAHAAEAAVRTVRVWLNAFIPVDLESAEVIGGNGRHSGKTALPTPGPIDAWYLTDQRGYSDDPAASSRMHSELELDLLNWKITREFHQCCETVEVDHETGEEKCREAAATDNMAFSNLQLAEGGSTLSVEIKGSSKNPCLKIASVEVSPNLDYEGMIIVSLRATDRQVVVTFDGKIETYPAFELYASVNDAPPVAVFREGVMPDATPLNLIGAPTREINRQAVIVY
jgi:hypothetical protein